MTDCGETGMSERKPEVLDLMKAILWLENGSDHTYSQVPDELYMAIREHVAKAVNAGDRGVVYKLGKEIYEALEFTKAIPEHRLPPLTCPCGGTMMMYWRPNSTRGIQCERCGAGGKALLKSATKKA